MVILPDGLYSPDAPELRTIAAVQTLASWRCKHKGPAYMKSGARIVYRGSDVLAWLDARLIEPNKQEVERPEGRPV